MAYWDRVTVYMARLRGPIKTRLLIRNSVLGFCCLQFTALVVIVCKHLQAKILYSPKMSKVIIWVSRHYYCCKADVVDVPSPICVRIPHPFFFRVQKVGKTFSVRKIPRMWGERGRLNGGRRPSPLLVGRPFSHEGGEKIHLVPKVISATDFRPLEDAGGGLEFATWPTRELNRTSRKEGGKERQRQHTIIPFTWEKNNLFFNDVIFITCIKIR